MLRDCQTGVLKREKSSPVFIKKLQGSRQGMLKMSVLKDADGA